MGHCRPTRRQEAARMAGARREALPPEMRDACHIGRWRHCRREIEDLNERPHKIYAAAQGARPRPGYTQTPPAWLASATLAADRIGIAGRRHYRSSGDKQLVATRNRAPYHGDGP